MPDSAVTGVGTGLIKLSEMLSPSAVWKLLLVLTTSSLFRAVTNLPSLGGVVGALPSSRL